MLIHEEKNQWNRLESPEKKFLNLIGIKIKVSFQIGENMDYSINGVGTSGW